MAGRPARSPAPPRAVPEEERPRRPQAGAQFAPAVKAASLLERDREPARLSSSYRRALDSDLDPSQATDPDAVRRSVLLDLDSARRATGRRLTVADALAASIISRVVDSTTRDAVLAVRELADRTEGPVVQRTQDVSVRYVVSVTPAGAVGEAPSLPPTPEQWEASARRDWDAARLPAAPADRVEDEA